MSRAEVKIYQYDGKLPFVQMMLNMMVAMGVLDRIPGHLVYGNGVYGNGIYGNGPYGYGNRSALTNPYLRALAMRGYPVSGLTGSGLYGRSLGLNYPGLASPWTSSPWMSSPWTGSGLPYGSGFGSPWSGSWLDSDSLWGNSSRWPGRYGYLGGTRYGPYDDYIDRDRAALWSSPSWGVLPVEDLAALDVPSNSPWDSDMRDAWSREPWSDAGRDVDPSDWSQPLSRAQSGSPVESLPPQQTPQQAPQQPIVLNNIITTGPAAPPAQPGPVSNLKSPLAKLNAPAKRVPRQARPVEAKNKLQASPLYKYSQQAQKYVLADPRDEQQYEAQLRYKKIRPPVSTEKREQDSRLCVTEHCGLKKPDITGLWISQSGEMLGVKAGHYLWSDGVSRYLTGQIKVMNEYLLASVEGYDNIMRFKYKLANDHLLTMQEDGTIREFVRVPTDLDAYRQEYY